MKKHRQWIYKAMAIVLPLIVLIMVEIILRLCGYGYKTDLFIPDPDDKQMLVMNRDISKKYFTVEENATIGNQESFYKEKPRDGIRIFVLGASSSLGFPYMHNGTFSRILKYRLQFEYPETEIEVINLSLTAINSYTLADFSKQLVNYQPDAILIYAGHNEYYGALGVASSGKLGRNPVWVKMGIAARELKLVQGWFRLIAKIKGTDKQITDYNLTLMERMAARQEVPYQSELFEQGISQFKTNLGDMLELFKQKNIPVFISTLACNLHDQKPLTKQETTGLHDPLAAYQSGNEAFSKGDYLKAKEFYTLAKEYDGLRFRAPEAMNEIIHNYSSSFSNVHLVDACRSLENNSPHGITGLELILEHVHPNLTGHRLISDEFHKALQEYEIFNHHRIVEQTIAPEDYPFTRFDTIYGNLSIEALRRQWPFNEKIPETSLNSKLLEDQVAINYLVKKINWGDAMQQLYTSYMQNKDYENALRIVEGMCLELPHNKKFWEQAAKLCVQTTHNRKALFYFYKVYRMSPSIQTAGEIAVTLLRLDQPVEAMPFIDEVIKQHGNANFNQLKAITAEIIQFKQQLSVDSSNCLIQEEIASRYRKMGNAEAASKYKKP